MTDRQYADQIALELGKRLAQVYIIRQQIQAALDAHPEDRDQRLRDILNSVGTDLQTPGDLMRAVTSATDPSAPAPRVVPGAS